MIAPKRGISLTGADFVGHFIDQGDPHKHVYSVEQWVDVVKGYRCYRLHHPRPITVKYELSVNPTAQQVRGDLQRLLDGVEGRPHD